MLPLRRAWPALVVVAACGGSSSSGPGPRTVRLADDARYADVHARCGGDAAAHSADLDTVVAYGDCLRAAGPVSSAVAPLVGQTLGCALSERSPLGDLDEDGFTATVGYPGASTEAGVELAYSRTLGSGGDRDVFTGPWAERDADGDRVRYRHDVGAATLGGYCDDSTVRGLVETLTVAPGALVYREDWRCAGRDAPSFHEVRCVRR